MVKLFGFEIKRSSEQPPEVESFAPKIEDDGATVVTAAGGSYGTFVDLEGSAKSEAELVSRYREISLQPEIEEAIDSIVEEAMDTDDDTIVSINLDKVEYTEKVKKRIREEFDVVLDLLNFNMLSYDIFRRWYIDGRLYYHAIIDNDKPHEGLKELRYIDPRKIRKVREIKKEKQGEVIIEKVKGEYFIYNDKGFANKLKATASYGSVGGMKIAKDSIVHVTSGVLDETNTFVLSHLHKAIRPMNILRSIEDATVIYTLARAPERRIFYIDVGGLPKAKAEQYMRDMMTRHKNKLVYDQTTGEVRDDRKYTTMLEDYWFPRREGNRSTEVSSLPGGGTLINIENIEYFQRKLYKALNVPITRLQGETGFTLGRSTEISRDEVKFSKFVARLRRRFSHLLYNTLEKQLILKKVIAPEDWEELRNDIIFDFAIDNYFSELKYSEILTSRVDTLQRMEPYIGKYYSNTWARKNILMQTDEDIEEMDKEIEKETGEGEGAEFGTDQERPEPNPLPEPRAAPLPGQVNKEPKEPSDDDQKEKQILS